MEDRNNCASSYVFFFSPIVVSIVYPTGPQPGPYRRVVSYAVPAHTCSALLHVCMIVCVQMSAQIRSHLADISHGNETASFFEHVSAHGFVYVQLSSHPTRCSSPPLPVPSFAPPQIGVREQPQESATVHAAQPVLARLAPVSILYEIFRPTQPELRSRGAQEARWEGHVGQRRHRMRKVRAMYLCFRVSPLWCSRTRKCTKIVTGLHTSSCEKVVPGGTTVVNTPSLFLPD